MQIKAKKLQYKMENIDRSSIQNYRNIDSEKSCIAYRNGIGHRITKAKCGKCNKLLPISEFYKDRDRDDGLCWWCKQCKKEYNRLYNRKKYIKEVKK